VGRQFLLLPEQRRSIMTKAEEKGSFQGFLGIDISKEKFDACCIGRGGEKHFQISLSMDRAGFDELLSKLSFMGGSRESILIGMESTACYHINLFSFLTYKGFNVIIINPLLISNFMKLTLRKTKTDKKDAAVIAEFLLLKQETLSQNIVSPHSSDLRDLARQRESLLDQMTAIKSDFKRVLSITFPELEHITGIFTKSVLNLLSRYPSAQAIHKAKRARIAKILVPTSQGRHNDETVGVVMKAAATSIGTATPAKEVVLKQKALILLQLEDHLKELSEMLIEQCQARMKEDIEILTSIRGIGEKSATHFLAELGGGITLYKSYKQVIAMAGIDPSVQQSGKYEGLSKISKRGNRHRRRIIWLMAVKAIQFNNYFRTYFQKRSEEGLIYKKAVLATAHKLIRVIFKMLSNKTLFKEQVNS
jgi:transposase